ncbi:hypothetical protein PINS_up004433 [Pythium insidiosum]|nr:hypothetical protein PINS_up004433 [Pythium insidiosum]
MQRKLREWQRMHMANDWLVTALVPITASRGVVLPLFDKIAALGVTLLLQLQALGVDLPVEVPHCGDLSDDWRRVLETGNVSNASTTIATTGLRLPVRVYDVCAMATDTTYSMSPFLGRLAQSPMFCESQEHCHHRFRGFDIKILALLLSRFDEIMLMDADTLFFSSPMALWSTEKYQETGTLFFHDRVSFERGFLDSPWFAPIERPPRDSSGSGSDSDSKDTIVFPMDNLTASSNSQGSAVEVVVPVVVPQSNASKIQMYLHNADVAPFRHLSNVPRSPAPPELIAQLNVSLPFQPSLFLLQSHSWNRRAGHQLDSFAAAVAQVATSEGDGDSRVVHYVGRG